MGNVDKRLGKERDCGQVSPLVMIGMELRVARCWHGICAERVHAPWLAL